MQVLPKSGMRVALLAVDADGLDIAVPAPQSWSIGTSDIALTVADDGLSATLVPKGPTVPLATLVVNAGNLTVTADVSYTNAAPPERVAAKLNLVFTPLDEALPTTSTDTGAVPGMPPGAEPTAPVTAVPEVPAGGTNA